MFWKLNSEEGPASLAAAGLASEGRYVLQRHRDELGEHLDLRLEQDGYLLGWRVGGTALDVVWATEKAPHPLAWLDEQGGASEIESGRYAWEKRTTDSGTLLLESEEACRRVRVQRAAHIDPEQVRAIAEALDAESITFGDAAKLVRDGLTARRRSIERLCGLGRELDGAAFDDALWRKSLAVLDLDEIHSQLRSFEARFDAKYPARPVSRPEALDDASEAGRFNEAFSILQD